MYLHIHVITYVRIAHTIIMNAAAAAAASLAFFFFSTLSGVVNDQQTAARWQKASPSHRVRVSSLNTHARSKETQVDAECMVITTYVHSFTRDSSGQTSHIHRLLRAAPFRLLLSPFFPNTYFLLYFSGVCHRMQNGLCFTPFPNIYKPWSFQLWLPHPAGSRGRGGQ